MKSPSAPAAIEQLIIVPGSPRPVSRRNTSSPTLFSERSSRLAVTPQMFAARRDEYRASWEAGTDLGLTNGVFIETHDEETGEVGLEPIYTTARPKKRGYHIWSAYSQMAGITWIRLASDWLIKLSEGRNGIQGFVNQHCGDPWEPGGLFSLPNEAELSSITVPYDAEVPLDGSAP